jgi:lactoylglutathione lyase
VDPLIKSISPDAISHRILHAGLTISNDKGADAFYKDILGFSEIWRGGANDSVTNWINMRLPETTDYLEYMLVNAPPNKQQLGSLHHIALMVPDMQQAVDLLRVRSEQLKYPVAPPRIGRNNRWQLNLFDPDGTRIELMEPFTFR